MYNVSFPGTRSIISFSVFSVMTIDHTEDGQDDSNNQNVISSPRTIQQNLIELIETELRSTPQLLITHI